MATQSKKQKPEPPPEIDDTPKDPAFDIIDWPQEEQLPPRLDDQDNLPVYLSDINPTDRKAEAWAIHHPEEPMYRTRCLECRDLMWTWSEKEDICERCGYELREKKSKKIVSQEKKRGLVNSFANESAGRVPVNVDLGRDSRVVNPYAPAAEPASRVNPFGAQQTSRKTFNPF